MPLTLQQDFGLNSDDDEPVPEETQRRRFRRRQGRTLKERRPNLDSVPRDCPAELVTIMESGWADEITDRPSFAGMVPMLEPITTGGERQAALAVPASVAAPWV